MEQVHERAELADILRGLPLFAGMDPFVLSDLMAEIDWFVLPGGALVCRQGDAPDALYVVISGALGVFRETEGTAPVRIGDINAGETVGEMALITGGRRTATVRALRDSELVRLSRAGFEALLDRHPRIGIFLARFVAERLGRAQDARRYLPRPRTFAILPRDEGVPAEAFTHAFAEGLRRFGGTEIITAKVAARQPLDWFHRQESACDYLVYLADSTLSAWTRLCLRQVDCILLVGRGVDAPGPWPIPEEVAPETATGPRRELVLLHEAGRTPAGTAAWLAAADAPVAHHVQTPAELGRLVRALTGRAVGVVLSGGGARGFAHIGVIRALKQSGMPIDLLGGTSMGAVVAASVAMGWDDQEIVERNRRSFVTSNPLSDFTLPVVSLVHGRKVSGLLQREFGEMQIEDLRTPFFCVTANLTQGRANAQRQGLLWRWLRASVSIPGVLRPVFDQGQVHVDGGVINNLPVDVMRGFGRGPVIGVDVGADPAFTAAADADVEIPLWQRLFGRRRRGIPNILQILWRSGTVNSGAMSRAVGEQTDLLIQPALESIDMLNWKGFDRAIEAGYAHTMRVLDESPRPLPDTFR